MSTDRSRLVSSIRRIVLTDPDLSSALDAWQNRGDQASSTGTGTSDAERDRLCCDGSTSDNPNPGADTRDTSDGGQDAGDGLNPDDPADIGDMGPGSLTGLHDCATGEPVCFNGSGFIPPDGWDDPSAPPLDPDFQPDEDTFWARGPDLSPDARTKGQLIEVLVTWREDAIQNTVFCDTLEYDDGSGYFYALYAETQSDCNQNNIGASYSFGPRYCPVDGSLGEIYCGTQHGWPTEDQMYEDSWPSDSCVNLAIKGGSIVGSKYDPENDGSYSKPMSEIELCDDFGNSFFLSPASNGGWKTIDATKTDGYLYDSQGNKIAHIDGNEYADPDI